MARAKVTCNDTFLFGALTYSMVLLCVKWHDYATCKDPLNVFLLVDYACIMLFRTSHFIAHKYSDSENAFLRKFTEFVKVGVIFTFFVAWTIVGTVWFSKSASCLPEKGQSLTFKIWLALCYMWIVVYTIVLLVQYVWFARDQRFADARHHPFPLSIMNMNDLRGLSEEQICRISSFQCPNELILGKEMCTVCIDGYTKTDLVKKLPSCRHYFHAQCIDDWLERKNTCPVCRAEVFGDEQLDHIERGAGAAAVAVAAEQNNNNSNNNNNQRAVVLHNNNDGGVMVDMDHHRRPSLAPPAIE